MKGNYLKLNHEKLLERLTEKCCNSELSHPFTISDQESLIPNMQ